MSACGSTESADTAGPAAAASTTEDHGMLPLASIRHLMRRAMGGEQAALSNEEAIDAVQACTSEFLSFIVSEARVRVQKEGGTAVQYSDIATALTSLGFKQFLEPLKAHMNMHYAGTGLRKPLKRPRPSNGGDSSVSKVPPSTVVHTQVHPLSSGLLQTVSAPAPQPVVQPPTFSPVPSSTPLASQIERAPPAPATVPQPVVQPPTFSPVPSSTPLASQIERAPPPPPPPLPSQIEIKPPQPPPITHLADASEHQALYPPPTPTA